MSDRIDRREFLGVMSVGAGALAAGKLTWAQSGSSKNLRLAPLEHLICMVHHNVGEPLFITKYVRANYLKRQGINGDAAKCYIQCAIAYDRYELGLVDQEGATWAWIQRHANNLDHLVAEYKKAGIPLYPFTDVLVVPKELMAKYGDEMKDDRGRLSIQRSKTQEVIRAQMDAIFRRFPDLGGLTIRFGETYLSDTPFHTGDRPVYTPADHALLINILREEVCVKRNKKLIYRTWDFGQLHTTPSLYLQATDAVAPHPNLMFSIKHTNSDFLRDVPLNRTLGIGKHPQIVEVSMMQAGCYGKGAYPYYIGRGVLHGWPEMEKPKGIASLAREGKLVGVFVWPRGDGWSGPYISSEFWVDLNMYVICEFAKRPWCNDEELFKEYCREKLGLDDERACKLYELSLLSADATFRGVQSELFHMGPWWQRDDKLNDVYREDVDHDKVLAEKAEVVKDWRRIEGLAREVQLENPIDQEYLEVSSAYGRIYFSIIEQIWRLNILWREERDEANKKEMRQALKRYDNQWAEWHKLERDHACCATLYMTSWPQEYPPKWRETPPSKDFTPNHDTPVIAKCREAVSNGSA